MTQSPAQERPAHESDDFGDFVANFALNDPEQAPVTAGSGLDSRRSSKSVRYITAATILVGASIGAAVPLYGSFHSPAERPSAVSASLEVPQGTANGFDAWGIPTWHSAAVLPMPPARAGAPAGSLSVPSSSHAHWPTAAAVPSTAVPSTAVQTAKAPSQKESRNAVCADLVRRQKSDPTLRFQLPTGLSCPGLIEGTPEPAAPTTVPVPVPVPVTSTPPPPPAVPPVDGEPSTAEKAPTGKGSRGKGLTGWGSSGKGSFGKDSTAKDPSATDSPSKEPSGKQPSGDSSSSDPTPNGTS